MAIRGITVVALTVFAGIAFAQETPPPDGPSENQSYAMGAELGNQLRARSVEVDVEPFIRGFKDGLSGKAAQSPAASTPGDGQRQKNEMDAQAFLAENKTKEGVVTLASGLQYKVLKAGEGPKPGPDDTVICNYRGTLLDGKEFDSSFKHRKPATFPVNRVIQGWTEALQLMPLGSKWQLFVPADLGYGERGAGSIIGPNQMLIFEVELIAIKGAPGSTAATGKNRTQRHSTAAEAGPAATMRLSFKLDPRLSGGTYGGDRWVSPPTFVGASAQDTIEIKAVGQTAEGKPVPVKPTWTPSDAAMVAVSPGEGDAVKVTIKRAGQSVLQVSSAGITRALGIKAEYKNNAIQVAIAQEP